MKKIIFLIIFISSLIYSNITFGYGGCIQYGMATETANGYCKCLSGYHFETSYLGETCVRDKTEDELCQEEFGFLAKSNGGGYCGCKDGYGLKDKIYGGGKECVSLNTVCQDKFGYNSTYNGLLDKCECSYGYDFKLKSGIYGNSYECTSCYGIYGLNSEYNSINKSCGCKDGYIIKDGKCELKSNSAYFFLSEYKDNTAIVISYYNKKKYLLELRFKTLLYKAEDFVGSSIVINMGTDFNVDKYDKFVLNNPTKTTDIVSDILNVEEVDDNYTLKTCQDVYGKNSEETSNNKCICKSGYQWNYNKTSCELILIEINTCDNINGYLENGQCYCNDGYDWSVSKNKCEKIEITNEDKLNVDYKIFYTKFKITGEITILELYNKIYNKYKKSSNGILSR